MTTTEPRITDEDVDHAHAAAVRRGDIVLPRNVCAVLESALRPGGLVARAVADELDRLAAHYPVDVFPDGGTSRDAISGTALRTVLTAQARLWREGER